MNLAQERLVFAWLLIALFFVSLLGAQRYPWLYVLAVPLGLFGFMVHEPAVDHRYSAALWRERDKEMNALFKAQPWLYPYYAVVGLLYAAGIGTIMYGVDGARIPSDMTVILVLLAPLILPVVAARQYEYFLYLGAQSNQPIHPDAKSRADARDSRG